GRWYGSRVRDDRNHHQRRRAHRDRRVPRTRSNTGGLMAIIKDTLIDLAGGADWDPKAYAEIWSPDELRDVAGDTATNKRLTVPITATGLETAQLKAGPALVLLRLGALRESLGPFSIVVPDDTAEHRLL